MPEQSLPAVALAAVPGRRRATLELAREIERRGFAGIYCASFGDAMGLCEALALVTKRIPFGTAIANLYTRHASDYASSAALIHELSGGRFRFGVGVSHERDEPPPRSSHRAPARGRAPFRRGAARGPARGRRCRRSCSRRCASAWCALAGEIAEGVVFANVARSHVARSLEALPPARAQRLDLLRRRHDPGLHLRRPAPPRWSATARRS